MSSSFWDTEQAVAVVPKSVTEQYRIDITTRNGKKFINFRAWYTQDGGLTWNPGRGGDAIPFAVSTQVGEAIMKAGRIG